MPANTTQAALIAISQPTDQPARVTQAAMISIQGPPVSDLRVSQVGLIYISATGKKSISLGQPIALDCWQPCTAYGTHAIINYLGNRK